MSFKDLVAVPISSLGKDGWSNPYFFLFVILIILFPFIAIISSIHIVYFIFFFETALYNVFLLLPDILFKSYFFPAILQPILYFLMLLHILLEFYHQSGISRASTLFPSVLFIILRIVDVRYRMRPSSGTEAASIFGLSGFPPTPICRKPPCYCSLSGFSCGSSSNT